MSDQTKPALLLGGAVVIAALIVAGVLLYLRSEQRSTELTERCRQQFSRMADPDFGSVTEGVFEPPTAAEFEEMFPECEGRL
jgi:hypothetical protein